MEDDFFNLEQTKKIIQQAERWDLYAKITPPFFLALATLLIVFNIIDFDAIFYIGLIMFGLTGVVWWFWSSVAWSLVAWWSKKFTVAPPVASPLEVAAAVACCWTCSKPPEIYRTAASALAKAIVTCYLRYSSMLPM